MNKKLFKDNAGKSVEFNRKTLVVVIIAAFIIGIYDGLYGPGTGTFLIIVFTVFAKMPTASANAHTKVINLSTNIAALVVFIMNGQVLFTIGIAAAASNMLGNYIGAGLVMTKGSKIVKPIVIIVLLLLLVKIITGY
ncbi:MAG: TSUP family transporter [Treponemataceae bacterium]|nr:TSUP family transporter [Treponemataceae bacterium]